MADILLVEDDHDVIGVIAEALRDAGHTVTGVSSFPEALRLIRDRIWNVVLTDMLLPGGGNGAELAVAAQAKGARAVIITGSPDQMTTLQATGIVHLKKPFTMQSIVEHINRITGGGPAG